MDKNETRKVTVEENDNEKRTTEETHKPGTAERDVLLATTRHEAATPDREEKTTRVEKK